MDAPVATRGSPLSERLALTRLVRAWLEGVYAVLVVTPNPYDPPRSKSTGADSPRPLRLFTPLAVAIHGLLVPPAGGILAILNYARLRDRNGAWKAVFYVVIGVALIPLGVALQGKPALLLVTIARFVFANLLYVDQRPLVHKHFAAGGKRGRWYFGWLAAFPFLVAALAIWQVLQPGVPAR
jgi:hypothetical protein